MEQKRVVSGMRPTGPLHLGHLYGVLRNWVELQKSYDCFFLICDLHALTTHYAHGENIAHYSQEMLIDWLACGVRPNLGAIVLQSQVPQHAELAQLLAMCAPLSWLERVPTYKEQQQKLPDFDLKTLGFLGYPLLQAADVLLYQANWVPVGEDQLPHIEFAREIARRFNHVFGKDADFIEKVQMAIGNLAKKQAKRYLELRTAYQQEGSKESLELAIALVHEHETLSKGDKGFLLAYLEGETRVLLTEPEALLTKTAKLTGLDGQKMSKSYNNCIYIRDDLQILDKKIMTMQTDPKRKRRTDPGTPEDCPVFTFHQMYGDDTVLSWVDSGCRSAGIGCVDCKKVLLEGMRKELQPIQEKRALIAEDTHTLKTILAQGRERAHDEAQKNITTVKEAMGLMTS